MLNASVLLWMQRVIISQVPGVSEMVIHPTFIFLVKSLSLLLMINSALQKILSWQLTWNKKSMTKILIYFSGLISWQNCQKRTRFFFQVKVNSSMISPKKTTKEE